MGRRDSIGVSQSLRGNPVLAIGAVQIAAEHSEAVGECAGVGVKERLLLDGIALGTGGVSPRDKECATSVVADFADSRLAFRDGTAMSAGEAAKAIVLEFFVEMGIRFTDSFIEDTTQCGHGESLLSF